MLIREHLKTASMFMNNSLKGVVSLMSLWGVPLFTCMQHVGTWRMFEVCSTRCQLVFWSLRLPWSWNMWNISHDKRHLKYAKKCNKVCCQTFLFWTSIIFGHLWFSTPDLKHPLIISTQALYLLAITNRW